MRGDTRPGTDARLPTECVLLTQHGQTGDKRKKRRALTSAESSKPSFFYDKANHSFCVDPDFWLTMTRGRDLNDFERGFIIGARLAGASVTKTAELARVSIGTVTKVTSAFKAMGKTSVSRTGHCGRKRAFSERDTRALVRYVKKNRRATVPQITENVNARRNQTVSARTVRRQLHREGYNRVLAQKPYITNASGVEVEKENDAV